MWSIKSAFLTVVNKQREKHYERLDFSRERGLVMGSGCDKFPASPSIYTQPLAHSARKKRDEPVDGSQFSDGDGDRDGDGGGGGGGGGGDSRGSEGEYPAMLHFRYV